MKGASVDAGWLLKAAAMNAAVELPGANSDLEWYLRNMEEPYSKESGILPFENDAESDCLRVVIFRQMLGGSIKQTCSRVAENHRVSAIDFCLQATREELKQASVRLGGIMAGLAMRGKFADLADIAKGLESLSQGKHYKPKLGREKSPNLILGRLAFQYLKKAGIERPSQSEFIDFFDSFGHSMTKAQASKLFDELGLKDEASDAREALSQAGKRRRGKG